MPATAAPQVGLRTRSLRSRWITCMHEEQGEQRDARDPGPALRQESVRRFHGLELARRGLACRGLLREATAHLVWNQDAGRRVAAAGWAEQAPSAAGTGFGVDVSSTIDSPSSSMASTRLPRAGHFRQLVRSSRTRIGCSSVLSRSRAGSASSGSTATSAGVETRERGILRRRTGRSRSAALAMEFHRARFVVGHFVATVVGGLRPAAGRERRRARRARTTRCSRRPAAPRRSSSRRARRLVRRRRPEGLLTQVLERIEARRADAAAHVALREAQRSRR